MIISGVRVLEVDAVLWPGGDRTWIFVEVETDNGIIGIGDATNWPGGEVVVRAIDVAARQVIGEDPTRIEYLWEKMYRATHYIGISGAVIGAISGIDIALWDILGKSLGAPVYQLLGGRCRESVPLYANYWTGGLQRTPAAFAEKARAVVAAGYRGLKLMPFARLDSVTALTLDRTVTPQDITEAVAMLTAVREAVGPAVSLYVEAGGKLSPYSFMPFVQAVRDLGIAFIEEPLPPENVEATARLARSSPVPIAVGERLYTHHGIRRTLELGGVSLLQPDIVRAGGLTAGKKMAAMADAYYVPIAPHNPNSPLSTVASAHLAMSTPNVHMLEYLYDDVPWREALLTPALEVDAGQLRLSDRPGLGFELDADVARQHPAVR